MLRGLQSLLRLRADEPQVEKSVARNETDRLLIEQVTALDEKFRIPIVLFYGQQMSAEEIGEVLGIPRGTVLSRLHAARECLRGGLVRKGVNWHERD
jgi:RNA polymerase sigma-70 factor (ECF subfamily)